MRWIIAVIGCLALLTATTVLAQEAPAGKVLYSRITVDGARLYVMSASGGDPHEVGNLPLPFNQFAAWSPDGKQLSVTCFSSTMLQDAAIYVVNEDGSGARRLPPPERAAAMAAWSPDGKQLAFMSGDPEGDPPKIYIADALGNGARRLTAENAVAFGPMWSADGKALFFGYNQPDAQEFELRRYSLEDDTSTALTTAGGMVVPGPGARSPEGNRLVFFVSGAGGLQNGEYRVYDLDARSWSAVITVEGPQDLQLPVIPTACWAPGGSALLATLYRDDHWGVFRVSLDGKQATRLTPIDTDCVGPACWAPS